MSTAELVGGILCFIIAGTCAFISIRHYMEKGFLLNNAYIWASKGERESMDKKPYYRQSAVVFCLLTFVFVVIGMSIVLQNQIIELLEIPLIVVTVVYTIVSAIKIEKNIKD